MWDFSSRNTGNFETSTVDCVSKTATSLKTYENDALMISKRISKQIKCAVKKQKKLKTVHNIKAAKIALRVENLKKRLHQADCYIKRVQALQTTEQLVNECTEMGIDPSLRIVKGGGTLKNAADELESFLREPVFFQAFDRDYDLN